MKIANGFILIVIIVIRLSSPIFAADLNQHDLEVIRTLEARYGRKIEHLEPNAAYPKHWSGVSIYRMKEGRVTELELYLGTFETAIDIAYTKKGRLDLSLISQFSGLNTLKIQDAILENGTSLIACDKLTHLELVSVEAKPLEFLKVLGQLESLSIHDLENFDVSLLQNLPKLSVLRLIDVEELLHFPKEFPHLSKLKTLDLSLKKLGTLSPFAKLTELRRFTLNRMETPHRLTQSDLIQVDDLSPLKSLGKLETLHLSGMIFANPSIEALKGLSRLKTLHIDSRYVTHLPIWLADWNPGVDLFEAFQGCRLKSPPLSVINKGRKAMKAFLVDERDGNDIHIEKYRDLAILRRIEQEYPEPLKERCSPADWNQHFSDSYLLDEQGRVVALALSEINSVEMLRAINALSQLNTLFFTNGFKEDVLVTGDALVNLKKLKHLDISFHGPKPNAKFVENLHSLKKLSLAYCGISDISFLIELPELEELDLQGNAIQEIGSIRRLKNLRVLSLDKSPVQDLSPIASLGALEELSLSEVPVRNSDLDLLKGLNMLKTLRIQSDRLDRLPEWIVGWNKELNLYESFFGCPLKNPPLVVIKKGREAIRQFFEAQRADTPDSQGKY